MGADDGDSVFAELGQQGLVGSMHAQLDEIVASRDQMERLLRVIVGLTSDLDLDATLHRIVTAAMELTGARYGALGVRAPDGRLLSFLHAGIETETAQRIGHLPVGKGVLGVLLDHPSRCVSTILAHTPRRWAFPSITPRWARSLGCRSPSASGPLAACT